MRKATLTAAFAMLALAGTACTVGNASNAPPGTGYEKVSSLVALPDFIPGLGTLYVQPDTLPAGPFLAYDRAGALASTIYMVPLADMQAHKKFEALAVGNGAVKQVDFQYNAGHPGVAEPHYHVILWHMSPGNAKLQ